MGGLECSEQIIIGRPLKEDPNAGDNNRIMTIDNFGSLKVQNRRLGLSMLTAVFPTAKDLHEADEQLRPRLNESAERDRNNSEALTSIGEHSLADILASSDVQNNQDVENKQQDELEKRPDVDRVWRVQRTRQTATEATNGLTAPTMSLHDLALPADIRPQSEQVLTEPTIEGK